MISILAAIQKVHEIDRAHDAAMQQLREWECAQHERIDRMEREIREREERRRQRVDECQRRIDASMHAYHEKVARDEREVEELLAEADALIKQVTSKRTRV